MGPWWIVLPALFSAGASIFGAHKQSSATRRAGDIQDRASRDALALEQRGQDQDHERFLIGLARAREQWNAEQAELARQTAEDERRYEIEQLRLDHQRADRYRLEYDARQERSRSTALSLAQQERLEATDLERYNFDQQRREPYRAAGHSAVGVLSQRAGLPAPPPRQAFTPQQARPSIQLPPEEPFTPPAPLARPPAAAPVTPPPSPTHAPPVNDGRTLSHGEVADLTPQQLDELIRYGFRLPPMGALVGRGGANHAYN